MLGFFFFFPVCSPVQHRDASTSTVSVMWTLENRSLKGLYQKVMLVFFFFFFNCMTGESHENPPSS